MDIEAHRKPAVSGRSRSKHELNGGKQTDKNQSETANIYSMDLYRTKSNTAGMTGNLNKKQRKITVLVRLFCVDLHDKREKTGRRTEKRGTTV